MQKPTAAFVIGFLFTLFLFPSGSSFAYALINLNTGATSSIETESTESPESESKEAVTVKYKEQGHLFALIPITFTVEVVAHADGTVEVSYPWYSVLTVDNKEEVEAEVRVAVDNALRAGTVGKVTAEGEVSNPTFTAEESAAVAAAIQAVLELD